MEASDRVWANLIEGMSDSSSRSICYLCGIAAPLANSHYIPQAILTRIGQDIETINDGAHENDASSTESSRWTRPLLCSSCETAFSSKVESKLDEIKIGNRVCFPSNRACRTGENSLVSAWTADTTTGNGSAVCNSGKRLF